MIRIKAPNATSDNNITKIVPAVRGMLLRASRDTIGLQM